LEQLLQSARAAESRGAPAEAFTALEQADLLQPNDPVILQQLARQCSDHSEDVTDRAEKLQWCTRALEYARRAVARQPDQPENLLSLAIALGKLARLADTRTRIDYARLVHDHATRAVALAPDYDYAHHVLGQWHVEVASIPAAQRWFARVVYGELPPASTREAILHFRRAVALAPAVPAHHAALGLVLQTEGQLDAARACFEQAAALPPHDHYDRLMQQRAQTALLR
jgi:tetratricopeptide (TPR) repeat protein